MSRAAPERLKRLWTSIFLRKGKNGEHTRLFDDLGPANRTFLSASIDPREMELIVIGSVRDQKNWLLLTTNRLAWSVGDQRFEIDNVSIRQVAVRRLERNLKGNLEKRQLQIETFTGDEYSIQLEPGAPLSGIWHVLNNIAGRNHTALELRKITRPTIKVGPTKN